MINKFMLVLLVLVIGCIFYDTSRADTTPFYKTDTFKKWTLQPTEKTKNQRDWLGVKRYGLVSYGTYVFSVAGLVADWATTIDGSTHWLTNTPLPDGRYAYENVLDLTYKYKNLYNVVRGYVHYDASRKNVKLGLKYKF